MAQQWMQEATAGMHKGALRATATRMGLLHGADDKLTTSDIATLQRKAHTTHNTKLARQAALAKTFLAAH